MASFDPGIHEDSYAMESGIIGVGEATYKPRNVEDAMNAVMGAILGGEVKTLATGSYQIKTDFYGVIIYNGDIKNIDPIAVAKAFGVPLSPHTSDISNKLESR